MPVCRWSKGKIKPDIFKIGREGYHEGVLDFTKDYFFNNWGYHVISVFEFFYMVNCIYWFACIEPSMYLWN